MSYITTAERIGMEKGYWEGMKKGMKEGMREGIQHEKQLLLRQLNRRFASVPDKYERLMKFLSK